MSGSLNDLERSFARYLRAEGRATGTVKLHCQAPRFFAAWLERRGKSATTDELTRANLVDWFSDLAGEVVPGTSQVRHAGMKRFVSWLRDEDELDSTP